jgi:hypothetical protein
MVKLVLLVLLSSPLYAKEEIKISIDGKIKTNLDLETIKKMKSQNIEFFNFVNNRAELYRGVPFQNFIEAVAHEVADQLVEIEFKSEDDYVSYVSKEASDKVNSILAYERADGDTFTRFSQKRKILINLGPLYHVWELKSVPREERLAHSSVYQIREINFITNKLDFGISESSVDRSVYLGYQVYKRNCISCHSIGRLGGSTSFDLVKRKTLETKGANYVMKYTLTPQSINPKSQMLPFSNFKNKNEMVQGLVDFLKFMQNPEEELKKKKAASSSNSYLELKKLIEETNTLKSP